jgi:phosphomannomutase
MNAEEALAAAERWCAADPDPATRAELERLIDARDGAALSELFANPIRFGTAGLRALVGPGPSRMNRAVIRRTTAGVARHLLQRAQGRELPPVVVGADARPSSASFLADAVGVLAAHGIGVRFFPEPVATPIVAYAARRLRAAAAIVITASHNPPGYNGYKLYGSDAAQIAPPEELEVAAEIERSGAAVDEPIIEAAVAGASPLARELEASWIDEYVRDVVAGAGQCPSAAELSIAYTPLHGVGYSPVSAVLQRAGFATLRTVAEQQDPDGTFPTVRFPNPEEPGALDRLLELAREAGADLALANDPDVDRLAAAVPDGAGGFVPLSGNQLGVLLGDFVLERAPRAPTPLVLESIVSSPMLEAIARAHGARLERTLTGFKWIWRAALTLTEDQSLAFTFAFEEALGYSVGALARDKDGISAALALAQLAALEKAAGSSLRARLERLFRRHGLWVSLQHSIVCEGVSGAAAIQAAMARLGTAPPHALAGISIDRVTDYRQGAGERPPWLASSPLIELGLGAQGRVLARPSGTEPKLKLYVDLRVPLADGEDVWDAHARATVRARELAEALAATLGLRGT